MVGGERFVLCQVKGINRCWTWNSNVSHASSLANFPSCVKAKRFHPCLSSRHFLPKIIYQIPASNIDSPGWTHLEQPKSAIFTLWFSSVASKKSWANWIIKIPNPVTSGNSDCFCFFFPRSFWRPPCWCFFFFLTCWGRVAYQVLVAPMHPNWFVATQRWKTCIANLSLKNPCPPKNQIFFGGLCFFCLWESMTSRAQPSKHPQFV